MLAIRPYRPEDQSAIVAMHARQCEHDGMDYILPNPCDPRQFATIVAEEDGRVVAAASGRRLCEGQTVLDPLYGGNGSSGPVKRWMLLAELIRESARVAYADGYTELMAATMPSWRGYGRRLTKELGFTRDLRAHYYLDIAARLGGN